MLRVILVIIGLTVFFIGLHGLTEEIDNAIHLQENIIRTMNVQEVE